ncbi:MAG: hypothetical protein KC766_38400 [Myxococcales bacterium]|nr:hypothetical protein [Myxococcales bacterium]
MSKSQTTFSDQQVGANADQALAALSAAGDDAPRLIDAWVAAGNAEAVLVAADSAQGPWRKSARRGLNVLKARGVNIPKGKRVARPTKQTAQRSWEAWLMAPDAAGTVAIIIATREPAGRYKACFAFARDGAGIFRIETGEFSASALREAMDKLIPGAGYRPVKVPLEWARARLAGCRASHSRNSTPEPLGLKRAAELIEPAPDQVPTHPFDEEGLELSAEDARELAESSGDLHRLPEFRSWFPTKPAVDELLMEVGKTLSPGVEPDQEKLNQTLEAKLLEATDRYFSPQRREELLRNMKDAALSVLAREGEQAALEVVAAMRMIEARGLITDPPSELAFLRGFFQKALSLLAARDGGALRIPIPGLPLGGAELSSDAAEGGGSAEGGDSAEGGGSAEPPSDTASPPPEANEPETPSAIDNEW